MRGSHGSHPTPTRANAFAQGAAIHAITCVNSLGTGVLWNGLGFLVEREYGYTQQQTFALYVATAVAYAVAAYATGPILRRCSGRVGPRAFMAILFAVQGLSAPLVLLPGSSLGLILVAVILSVCGAMLWPVVEAYVSSGKHGPAMRRSIGLWCINWMASVGSCLLLMAPLYASGHTRWAMVAILPISLLSIACLRWLPREPLPHTDEHNDAPESYRPMLASARVLLPASYMLVGAISALLPFVIESLQVDPALRTPIGSLWLFIRLGAVAILAFTHFWHGRWQGLVLAALLLCGGFTLVALAPSVPALLAGMAAFGIGHGLLYYSALYYAMRLESAGVEAGGMHEALIGIGYIVGPGAALAGGAWDGSRGIVIVELVGLTAAMLLAVRAWRRTAA